MAQSDRILAALAVATAFALASCQSGPQGSTGGNSNVKILAKASNGNPTEVKIDGKDWAVCSKQVTDHCINPRASGLAWGDRPLSYWPGKPASEMRKG